MEFFTEHQSFVIASIKLSKPIFEKRSEHYFEEQAKMCIDKFSPVESFPFLKNTYEKSIVEFGNLVREIIAHKNSSQK